MARIFSKSGQWFVIAGTGIAGIAGYLIIWAVPNYWGFEQATPFVFFWTILFFCVGLASGIQQEVTRAVGRGENGIVESQRSPGKRLFILGFAINALFLILLIALRIPITQSYFSDIGGVGFGLLVTGLFLYSCVAILLGVHYGLGNFLAVGIGLVVESITRLVFIGIALYLGNTLVLLIAVLAPFAINAIFLFWFLRRKSTKTIMLDVSTSKLLTNTLKTIAGASAVAILMSGFPLLIMIYSSGIDATRVSFVIVLTTFFRAPLMIVALALQSLLIVYFQKLGQFAQRTLLRGVLLLMSGGLVLGLFAVLVGPNLLTILFPSYEASGNSDSFFFTLVLSSALMAALTISGASALAEARHGVYLLGWALAAGITVVVALVKMPFDVHLNVSLLLGPAIGLVVSLLLSRNKRGISS